MRMGKGYTDGGASVNAVEAIARGEAPEHQVRAMLEALTDDPDAITMALAESRSAYHHVTNGDGEVVAVDFHIWEVARAYVLDGKDAARQARAEWEARVAAQEAERAARRAEIAALHAAREARDRRRRGMALASLRAAGFQVNPLPFDPAKVVVVGNGVKRRGKPENLAKEMLGLDVFKEVQ